MRRFILRLASFVRTGRADADLSREIDSHLHLLEEHYLAKGMSAEDARLAARRAFGGQVEQARLHHRDARSFHALDECWLDVKLGVRMLVKFPGLTLVGGLGMAVAIAISTASFAFFYAYMSSTLPLDEGERIVALENWNIEVNNEERRSIHDLAAWRNEMTSMEEIGAFRTIGRNLIVPGGASEPVRLAELTASSFRIARVKPILGRTVLDEDEQTGAPAVVVIGHDVWHSRFASDPSIVGREVRFGNTVHTVVGVMPEGFQFPVNHSYWAPLRITPAQFPRGEGPEIFIFGRLARGVTIDEAQAELTTVGLRSASAYPEIHASLRPRVLPYAYPILDIQDVSLWQVGLMQLTVSLLLLVVAVNIAVLVYARTATRQGEIAVRTALGASRSRIVGQLFVEALVLSAVAAAAGLGLARLGLDQAHLMQMEGARPPYWIDYRVPSAAIVYVVGLALLAAAIAGVLPALHATGRRVHSTLRQLGGGSGLRLGATWTALIVAQVALAVAAIPIAISIAWGEVRSATTAPGFDPDSFLAATFAMDPEPPPGVDPDAYRGDLSGRFLNVQRELVARLEAESWVSDVSFGLHPPGGEQSRRVEVEAPSAAAARLAGDVRVNKVDLDFFDAFDAALLTGRRFGSADRQAPEQGAPVLVNRAFVAQILGHADAVGRRLRYVTAESDGSKTEIWYEVVGVVANLHANAADPGLVSPAIYHPLASGDVTPVTVVVHESGGTPSSFIGRVREITAAIDPTVRLSAYPLAEIDRQGTVALRLVTAGLALVTASVLLLSAAGIYALMSFTVSHRRKEIGIRAALGADSRRLLRNVFARSATQLGVGIVLGVGAAVTLHAASGGTLPGAEAAVVLPAMALVMLAVGLLASVGPARAADSPDAGAARGVACWTGDGAPRPPPVTTHAAW